jgi:hypothetical protein
MTRPLRIFGRVAGALVVLAALPGLAACTPAALPLTALRSAAGEPVVLLAGCPDYTIDEIQLYTSTTNVTASVDGPRRRIARTGAEVPASMPLFGDPPAGWKVTDEGLTELAADGYYSLVAYEGAQGTVGIGFAAADLAALRPDEVLIGARPNGHRTTTEQEFRERAKDAC